MAAPAGDASGSTVAQRPRGAASEAPSAWTVYVQVNDVDAAVAKAKTLGGNVIVPKTPIPQMGHFAIIADPTGAVFGIWAK